MKHRVLSVFLALVVVLFSVRVPDVDAAATKFYSIEDFETWLNRSEYTGNDLNFYNVGIRLLDEYSFDTVSSDDLYLFRVLCVLTSSSEGFFYFYYAFKSDPPEFSLNNDGEVCCNYFCCNIYADYNSGDLSNIKLSENISGSSIVESSSTSYFYPNPDPVEDKQPIEFVIDANYPIGEMDFNSITPNQFTLTAVNNSDSDYYNYCFYISSVPATSGIQKSFSDAVYFMSSTQWCMKYTWSSIIPSDDVSVSDWIKDSYGNVVDSWGNTFNPEDSYMGRHGSGSSSDGIFYYALSQQDKCPFYLIKPGDSRSHVIPYSALNLEVGKTYYANIIYMDTTDYGVVPSSNSWGMADTSHNNYREHPLYNLNLLSSFCVDSATEFSVVDGNFVKDNDGLYDYKDVVDNSNPASSSATMSSVDNSVSINNANSYDNSSTVSYINYGTIYHNCTWGSSGSGGLGSSIVAPTVPEFDFDQLTAGCGNFLKFVKHVFFECLPEIFTTMLLAAFAVVIYCRVWGR